MTSIPASRSARAMIFAPRSCPSRPGLATTTRIFLVEVEADIAASVGERPPAAARCGPRRAVETASGRAALSSGDLQAHPHVRLVDRADDRVGAGARQPLRERARALVGGAEPHRALGDRD